MAEKKEKPAHVDTLEKIAKKAEARDAYLWAHQHEHELIIGNPKKSLIDKLGAEGAYKHLKTSKGQKEYAGLAAKEAENFALKKIGIKRDKLNEYDLGLLVKGLYGVNEKTFEQLATLFGPDLDHTRYQQQFLNNHLEEIKQYVGEHHLSKFDSNQTPAILKHIGVDKYLDVNLLKNDQYKSQVAQIIADTKGGKDPQGEEYYKRNLRLKPFLKKEYT